MEDPVADTRDIKRWFLSSFIESAQRSKGRIFDRWMRSVQAKAWLEGAMVASRRFAGEGVNPADWDQGNPYKH